MNSEAATCPDPVACIRAARALPAAERDVLIAVAGLDGCSYPDLKAVAKAFVIKRAVAEVRLARALRLIRLATGLTGGAEDDAIDDAALIDHVIAGDMVERMRVCEASASGPVSCVGGGNNVYDGSNCFVALPALHEDGASTA